MIAAILIVCPYPVRLSTGQLPIEAGWGSRAKSGHCIMSCTALCTTLHLFATHSVALSFPLHQLLTTMFSSAIFYTALNFSVLLLGIHLMQLIVCWCVCVEKCVCHRTSNHSPCILEGRVFSLRDCSEPPSQREVYKKLDKKTSSLFFRF